MINLKREDYSCDEEFIAKVYGLKLENTMTNKECNTHINSMLGTNYSESTTRGIAKYINLGQELQLEKSLSELKGENINTDNKDENNEEFNSIKNKYKETIELNKDKSQTSDKLLQMSEEDCKNIEFLLKSHGYDSRAFELLSAKNNIWNSYSKQDGVMTLYSSKITVKPRTEYLWNKEDIDKIFDSLKSNNKNSKKIIPKQYENNGKILVLPIADFHFGLLSDVYSNGNDYNIEIAEELFMQVIEDVIENNKGKKYEKIVFVTGNDTTNSDNVNSTTTHGTPQQDSAMWFTVVDRLTNLLVKGIGLLGEEIKVPIDVVYVPSNHDLHTMYGIVQTLKAWYREDTNITVDTSPLPRKYYQYGKNILAFSHDVKVKDALKIVSTEAKDMWSDSKRVIFMLAHLHQSMEYEKQGMVEILRLPTISGYSRWSNTKGYVQTERKNQAFVLDYNKGIIGIQNTILDL